MLLIEVYFSIKLVLKCYFLLYFKQKYDFSKRTFPPFNVSSSLKAFKAK